MFNKKTVVLMVDEVKKHTREAYRLAFELAYADACSENSMSGLELNTELKIYSGQVINAFILRDENGFVLIVRGVNSDYVKKFDIIFN